MALGAIPGPTPPPLSQPAASAAVASAPARPAPPPAAAPRPPPPSFVPAAGAPGPYAGPPPPGPFAGAPPRAWAPRPPPGFGYAPRPPFHGPPAPPAPAKAPVPRMIAGKAWTDASLAEWPENDFRIFVGDLGNDASDETLGAAFRGLPAFAMARVVRDKRTGKSKGYGFVSFLNAVDGASALKAMDGAYVGNRPIKLRRSNWDDRTPAALTKRGRLPGKRALKKHCIVPQPGK